VHNTYLQWGAEWGIQGLVLWLGFIGATLLLLWKSCRRSRADPWYYYRFLAVMLALVGRLTAGIFTTAFYGESIYWMCSLAFALHRIQSTELEKLESSWSTETVEAAPAALPVGMVARSRA
jgi:O-antigen ligase